MALPIAVVALGAIFLVTHGTIDVRSKTTALADIENAAHWLTRDIMMGQNIVIEDEPTTANISWNDYSGGMGNEIAHYVFYTHSGTELLREYDSADNTTIAGRNLSYVGFSPDFDSNLVTVTLTSTPEEASRSTVTRTYIIRIIVPEE